MQQHGSKYFPRRPHPARPWGQNSTFLNMVMLHIKLKGTWLQIFCPQTASPHDPMGLVQEVKTKLFQNMVRLHIKLNGIMSAVANILPTDPPPWTQGQKVNIQLFQNMVIFDIKLEGITNAAIW